jgi:hypothetical protein
VTWLNAACRDCGSDFRVRPVSRAACPGCGSFDVATWRDDDDQWLLFDPQAREGGPVMLDAGSRAQIEVNKAERDAIEQVIHRLASNTDEFERKLLQELLDKIDSAPTIPAKP